MARQKIGVQKVVKMTLPEEDWQRIMELIENEHATSVPDYFRQLHQAQFPTRKEKVKR